MHKTRITKRAATSGDLDMVKNLIEEGADVNWSQGEEPSLLLASREGHIEVVKLLIEAGAEVDSRGKDRMTPLLSAAARGHVEVATELIKAGAEVEAKNSYGYTPLNLAVACNRKNIVELLIQSGSNVNTENRYGCTPLRRAIKDNFLEIAIFLINSKADITNEYEGGNTPLHLASHWDRLDIVKSLIKAGAMVDQKNNKGKTPLHVAAEKGYLNILKVLIEAKANIDVEDEDGDTPLYLASECGKLDIVKSLIMAGARVDKNNNKGKTPLLIAAENRYWKTLENIKSSIEANAEVEDEDGNKPFLHASKICEDSVRSLLERGANVDHQNKLGKTAWQISTSLNISTLLIKWTLLHNPTVSKPEHISVDSRWLSTFWDDCKQELAIMQSTLLGESTISVCKCLQESNLDKLAGYMSNECFNHQRVLAYANTFPNYADLIKDKFNEGMKREILLYQSNILMLHCDLEIFPPELQAMITNLLPNSDLENLIKCAAAYDTQ